MKAITEADVDKALNRIRVVAPATLPTDQHHAYARSAVRQQLERERMEQEQREQREARKAEIDKALADNAAKQEAKRKAEAEAQQ